MRAIISDTKIRDDRKMQRENQRRRLRYRKDVHGKHPGSCWLWTISQDGFPDVSQAALPARCC